MDRPANKYCPVTRLQIVETGRYKLADRLYDYELLADGRVWEQRKIIGRVDNKPAPTGDLLPRFPDNIHFVTT